MNIISAFRYRECGYRVRRTVWAARAYIDPTSMRHTKLSAQDVLTDDWELITEGIVKDFPITYSD